jgi:hypothetical protein
MMHSLSIYARLFARAICGTEAEHFLLNGLLRLSSTSAVAHALHHPSIRPALTYPSTDIQRVVHLVTASSGHSNKDLQRINPTTKHRTASSTVEQTFNVYGDDAFFMAKHRLGDFLGKCLPIDVCLYARSNRFFTSQVWLTVWEVGVNVASIHRYSLVR